MAVLTGSYSSVSLLQLTTVNLQLVTIGAKFPELHLRVKTDKG